MCRLSLSLQDMFSFCVAACVVRLVACNLHFSVGVWRDVWSYTAFQQRMAEPVGIISFIAEQGFSVRNGCKHQGCALDAINRKYGRDTLRLGSSGHHPSWALRRKMLSPSYSTNWAELLRVG
jgi:Domain of unknown function (DUF4113)